MFRLCWHGALAFAGIKENMSVWAVHANEQRVCNQLQYCTVHIKHCCIMEKCNLIQYIVEING